MAAVKQRQAKQHRFGRADWLSAARHALITGGVDAIKVERLAKALNVTRGGFYWHFRDRDDLLNALLASWEKETSALFEAALQGNHVNGMEEMVALAKMWMEEESYSSAYDAAVRDWARISRHAARAVNRVDHARIDIIKRIFLDLGYEDDEAFIRARITYFHQVGYYTLGLSETLAERRRLLPLYLKVLTGTAARGAR